MFYIFYSMLKVRKSLLVSILKIRLGFRGGKSAVSVLAYGTHAY